MPNRIDGYNWEFFIAHAGTDRADAERIYDFLKPHARVFLDSFCITLGDNWDTKLAEAQKTSFVTVVLISLNSEEAYYEREEIATAIALARKDEHAHRVVPVYLDREVAQSGEVPYGLRLKHGLTVSNELGLGEVAARLLELLERVTANVDATTHAGNLSSTLTPARPADAKCKAQLVKWVDKILSTHLPECGAFDWRISPPSGAPGGVWQQAQCLTGILRTSAGVENADKANLTFEFIQKLQKEDGGWAYSGNAGDTVTVTEVSCWIVAAYTVATRAGIWASNEKASAAAKTAERALQHILERRFPGGGWCPTGDVLSDNTRTYTTALAVWCLLLAKNTPGTWAGSRFDKEITEGIKWLLKTRRNDFGWVPNPNRVHQWDKHPGLNAQVLFILMQSESSGFQLLRNDPFFQSWKREFLADRTWRDLEFFQNSGIRDVDQWLEGKEEYRIEGSTFLWCPWTLAALHAMSVDSGLSEEEGEQAVRLRNEVMLKILRQSDYIGTNGTYELAETIVCVAYALS